MEVDFEGALGFFKGLSKQRLGCSKLAFEGDLGAGKTFFIKQLLGLLDPKLAEQSASPSFGLCNNYVAPGFEIDHFDLYRLDRPDQIEETGLWESLEDPDKASWIEWASMFGGICPACDLVITIKDGPSGRKYLIEESA